MSADERNGDSRTNGVTEESSNSTTILKDCTLNGEEKERIRQLLHFDSSVPCSTVPLDAARRQMEDIMDEELCFSLETSSRALETLAYNEVRINLQDFLRNLHTRKPARVPEDQLIRLKDLVEREFNENATKAIPAFRRSLYELFEFSDEIGESSEDSEIAHGEEEGLLAQIERMTLLNQEIALQIAKNEAANQVILELDEQCQLSREMVESVQRDLDAVTVEKEKGRIETLQQGLKQFRAIQQLHDQLN